MTVLNLIARHEGFRCDPYADSRGIPTVGIGHNLTANPLPGEVYPMSVARAQELLQADLDREAAPIRALPWFGGLDEVRQAVLLDMSFNLGAAGLLKWRPTLALFAAGDWEHAAEHLLDSTWASQVGPRATEDAAMVRSGQWPAWGVNC